MEFYGKGLVWDKENNKPLCKFEKDGVLWTNDIRTMETLLSLGYKNDGTEIPRPKQDDVETKVIPEVIPEVIPKKKK